MQERWAHLQVQQQQPPPQLASTVAKNENKFTRGGNNNNKNNNNKRRRQIWPCLFGHLPATFGGKQQHSEWCRPGRQGGDIHLEQPRPSWLWTKADLCALPAKYGAEYSALAGCFAYLLQFTKRASTIHTHTHTHRHAHTCVLHVVCTIIGWVASYRIFCILKTLLEIKR